MMSIMKNWPPDRVDGDGSRVDKIIREQSLVMCSIEAWHFNSVSSRVRPVQILADPVYCHAFWRPKSCINTKTCIDNSFISRFSTYTWINQLLWISWLCTWTVSKMLRHLNTTRHRCALIRTRRTSGRVTNLNIRLDYMTAGPLTGVSSSSCSSTHFGLLPTPGLSSLHPPSWVARTYKDPCAGHKNHLWFKTLIPAWVHWYFNFALIMRVWN